MPPPETASNHCSVWEYRGLIPLPLRTTLKGRNSSRVPLSGAVASGSCRCVGPDINLHSDFHLKNVSQGTQPGKNQGQDYGGKQILS